VHVDEEEPKKLPLNDTVQKEDPDAFANKIKQAVLRYDNEMKNQMEAEAQKSNGNEINEYFRDNFPDFSDRTIIRTMSLKMKIRARKRIYLLRKILKIQVSAHHLYLTNQTRTVRVQLHHHQLRSTFQHHLLFKLIQQH